MKPARAMLTALLPAAVALIIFTSITAFGQRELGELRLQVKDPRGAPLSAQVFLLSEANQISRSFLTGQDGAYVARRLPFGAYHLRISHPGFRPYERIVEIRSEVPLRISVELGLAPVESRINVTDSATLLDPERAATAYSIGGRHIGEQMSSQLGRGLIDLVQSEPGWLTEANGVLHPRGSEYDVQYVVDGLPLTENLSPAFAPPRSLGSIEEMRVITAGIPAEYGRKLGGVVEVTTRQSTPPGLHMTAAAQGGSFSTAAGYAGIGYARGANQLTLTGDAGQTHRYLDPPVLANYTNQANTGGFTAGYSRDLSQRSRLRVSVSHHELRYAVPNELVQQAAGQLQNAASVDTSGQADYQRTLSPDLLLTAEASVRDHAFQLWSNHFSVPVIIGQQRGFREGYGRVALAGVHGSHDWKLGASLIANPVRENLQYTITDPAQFDPGTLPRFSFVDRRTDREPGAFVQDAYHKRNWNASLGVRYDHYGFVVNESAWSPRAAVSHYFPAAGLLVHASYDRVFQTPAIENLLLASSPALQGVSRLVLRLPVRPARANYYELGLTKAFWGRLRLDVNVFRRAFTNFPDDDTLLDTGVSFPIADASARIQGIEGKLELPQWRRFSGFLSFANQEGVGRGPITGGLFIGAEAIASVPENTTFWISQDQRNTARAELRFQASPRVWMALENSYGSGLPVELDTGDADYSFLLAQYGPRVLNQVDFARGRVRPSYLVGASLGATLYHKEGKLLTLELQGSNLTGQINLINFASLFSGTALGPPRSVDARVRFSF